MRPSAAQRSAKAIAITLALATIAAACGQGDGVVTTNPAQGAPAEVATLESCERSLNEGATLSPGFLLLAYDADWYRIPSAVADSAFVLEVGAESSSIQRQQPLEPAGDDFVEGEAAYQGLIEQADVIDDRGFYDATVAAQVTFLPDQQRGLELARGADVYLHIGRAGAAALVFAADSDGRMYALGNCVREQTLDPLFAFRDSLNADVDQASTEEEYFVRFAQSEELRAGFEAYLRG